MPESHSKAQTIYGNHFIYSTLCISTGNLERPENENNWTVHGQCEVYGVQALIT